MLLSSSCTPLLAEVMFMYTLPVLMKCSGVRYHRESKGVLVYKCGVTLVYDVHTLSDQYVSKSQLPVGQEGARSDTVSLMLFRPV